MRTIAGDEDLIGFAILVLTQLTFFSVVSYMVIKKKGMFESLGDDCDSPWKFGGWFIGMWFFATTVGAIIALAWPVMLMFGTLFAFGAGLFKLRERYGGKDDVDYEDKSGPD